MSRDRHPELLASFDLFAHNNTQPLDRDRDRDRAEGPRRGQVGGEEAPASLAPLPSVLGGEEEGGGSPYPPECKQQQMNKNKNTKGRRKVLGVPYPRVFPVTSGRPLTTPSTRAPLVLGAAWRWPHPQGRSPGLRTAGPAARTSDGRRAPCWYAGSAGTSEGDTGWLGLREEAEG